MFSFNFFCAPAHFHFALVAARISHFLTAATNFHVVFPTKNESPSFFISRSRSLLPFYSLSIAGLPPYFSYFSFSLSQALYSKFVDKTTQIQKQFPLSVFVLIDSLVVSALQDAGGMRFPSKITLSCIWVAVTVN